MGIAIAAAVLALGQAPAHAQSTPTADPPPAEVGPRELQNFNLQGTVSRPGESAPAPSTAAPPPAAARPPTRPPAPARTATTPSPAPQRETARNRSASSAAAPQPRVTSPAPVAQRPSLSSVTVPLPPIDGGNAPQPTEPGFTSEAAAATLAPDQGPSIWPWLLAAMALGAGAAFLFWRRSAREAYAGGPPADAFVAPEPDPRPRAPAAAPLPAPAPPPPAPPQPIGIVSTRLRPWIDISFAPLRCVIEEDQVVFEFELGLVNSGNAPAHDVLIEASMFNAGPTQDRDIGTFFANPVARGERTPELAPMKRLTLRPQVVVERENLRLFEAGGRRVFVPLIAFNALYRWGRGEGQTSAAYLLGRDMKRDKMAPFRIDLGPRIFRGLGAKAMPLEVRK